MSTTNMPIKFFKDPHCIIILVPFEPLYLKIMDYFQSPAFFLEEGRCSTFEFGAYLGSCRDPEGQRRRAIEFLQYFGVVPKRQGSAKCPKCKIGSMTPWTDTGANVLGWRWKCLKNPDGSRGCGATVSPLKGTLLGNAHIPPEKCLKLVLCWFLQHRVTEAAEDCGVCLETAVDWYRYLREVARVVEGHDCGRIGGMDDIVEVDESKCFKRKYGKGRLLQREIKDVWITGGISRKTKMAFAQTVPNRTRETLHPFLVKHIEKDTFVFTDGWAPYLGLETIISSDEPQRAYFKGFAFVNHSKNFVRPEPETISGLCEELYSIPRDFLPELNGDEPRAAYAKESKLVSVHTQNIERMWEELKKILRTSRGSDDAIEDYIGEFLYRHNILRPIGNTGKRLEKLLMDICRVYPGFGKVPITDVRRSIPYPKITYSGQSVTKPQFKRKRPPVPEEKTNDFDITFEELQESSSLTTHSQSLNPPMTIEAPKNRRKQNVSLIMYDVR